MRMRITRFAISKDGTTFYENVKRRSRSKPPQKSGRNSLQREFLEKHERLS